MSGTGTVQPGAAGFHGLADISAGLQALGGARLLAVTPRRDLPDAVGKLKLRKPGSFTDGIGQPNATFVVRNAPEGLQVIDTWKGKIPAGELDPAHLVTRGLRAAARRFADEPDALFEALVEHGVAVDFRGRHKQDWREFLLHEALKARLGELVPSMRQTIAMLGLKLEVRSGQTMGLSFTEIVVRSETTVYGSVRSNLRDASGAIAIGPSRLMSDFGSNPEEKDLVMETVLIPLNYLVMISKGEIKVEAGILADLKTENLLTDSR